MAKTSSSMFCLEGQFQGFAAGKSSPFKYLELAVNGQSYRIKLNKKLRLMLFRHLQPGDWLRVAGKQKLESGEAAPRLKAKDVITLREPPANPIVTVAQTAQAVQGSQKAKAKVLVCQKSSCRKRGAQAVCARLETALAQANLQGQVTVKPTGCMDRCKAGPQVVVMPDKARYNRVSPEEVPQLVERHFTPAMSDAS